MNGLPLRRAQGALSRHLCALGLLVAICVVPHRDTSAASHGHRTSPPTRQSKAAHLLSTPLAVRDVAAYQAAVSAAGRTKSIPTTGAAQADQVELIVFHFFPGGETEWSWTDPATGSQRVDRFAANGRPVQSTIIVGDHAEFIGYPRKEESYSLLPAPVRAGSSLRLMRAKVRQQIGMASAGWKRTGTSARINGHTTHLYEQDGPMRFDDGATGLGADVAYIDVTSMLVYRQVLLDLRHGRRIVVSGFDNDYRVVAGATASSARVFRFVTLAGFTAGPPLPAQHK